jgi:hypothetical protein
MAAKQCSTMWFRNIMFDLKVIIAPPPHPQQQSLKYSACTKIYFQVILNDCFFTYLLDLNSAIEFILDQNNGLRINCTPPPLLSVGETLS